MGISKDLWSCFYQNQIMSPVAEVSLLPKWNQTPHIVICEEFCADFSKNQNINYVTNLNGQSVNLGDTEISFSPKLVSSVQISYDPSLNFNISLLNKFVGEQYMSNTESDFSRLDSYTTTDLSIKYKFDKTYLFTDIVVTAMINNILNIEYVSNGYYYTYDDTWSDPNLITTIEGTGYYPQATRNFLLGITLKL